MKSENGITLIAIIITIIIMLILAGVSINSALGDDVVISKSEETSENAESTRAKEIILEAWSYIYTGSFGEELINVPNRSLYSNDTLYNQAKTKYESNFYKAAKSFKKYITNYGSFSTFEDGSGTSIGGSFYGVFKGSSGNYFYKISQFVLKGNKPVQSKLLSNGVVYGNDDYFIEFDDLNQKAKLYNRKEAEEFGITESYESTLNYIVKYMD